MYTGKLVFSQVMEHLPLHVFHLCVNRYNGNCGYAQVFVGIMVDSNLTDTEVTWSQSLADWTGSHVRACGFMVAVPYRIVSVNLLSGVD